MRPVDPIREGERIMTICNACRYCQGYCAVFPAMERRRVFTPADLNHLANLCHDCGECFYSCQYAPPHEFAVNVPKTLARIRVQSYQQYAWPLGVARLLERNIVFIPMLLALVSILLFAWGSRLSSAPSSGDFYLVTSRMAMTGVFAVAGLAVFVILAAGCVRFWRETGSLKAMGWDAWKKAITDALSLENLRSQGAGCPYPEEQRLSARRWFHHATFYGFLLCFASTSVAAFYENVLGWRAPYPYLSVPVVLGAIGGIGLVLGPAGLFALKLRRNPATEDVRQSTLDVAFLSLLVLTSLSGLLLLTLRETRAMGTLLVVHLGIVMALFLTLPYGKFVHAIYRFAALLRNAREQFQAHGQTE